MPEITDSLIFETLPPPLHSQLSLPDWQVRIVREGGVPHLHATGDVEVSQGYSVRVPHFVLKREVGSYHLDPQTSKALQR